MATKTQEPVIGDGSLHVGDRVVYPNQGICRITGVDTKNIAGQNWKWSPSRARRTARR